MLPAGFELAVTVSEWPQTHGLDRAATGVGCRKVTTLILSLCSDVAKLCVETEKNALARSPDFRDARLMQHHMMLTGFLRSICAYLESTVTFISTDHNERIFVVIGLYNLRISEYFLSDYAYLHGVY